MSNKLRRKILQGKICIERQPPWQRQIKEKKRPLIYNMQIALRLLHIGRKEATIEDVKVMLFHIYKNQTNQVPQTNEFLIYRNSKNDGDDC